MIVYISISLNSAAHDTAGSSEAPSEMGASASTPCITLRTSTAVRTTSTEPRSSTPTPTTAAPWQWGSPNSTTSAPPAPRQMFAALEASYSTALRLYNTDYRKVPNSNNLWNGDIYIYPDPYPYQTPADIKYRSGTCTVLVLDIYIYPDPNPCQTPPKYIYI